MKNGVGLEEWFDPTIKNAESKATIVEAATGVTVRHGAGRPTGGATPTSGRTPATPR